VPELPYLFFSLVEEVFGLLMNLNLEKKILLPLSVLAIIKCFSEILAVVLHTRPFLSASYTVSSNADNFKVWRVVLFC